MIVRAKKGFAVRNLVVVVRAKKIDDTDSDLRNISDERHAETDPVCFGGEFCPILALDILPLD